MSALPKSSKIVQYINYRMRVTIQDGRVIIGRFLAFDKHMNVVICDAEEFRRIKQKGKEDREEKRTLGMVLIRGESVVAMSVVSPPPEMQAKVTSKIPPQIPNGPGIGRAVGRGMGGTHLPHQPPQGMGFSGLTGQVKGVGGPNPQTMIPGQQPPPFGKPHGFNQGPPPPFGKVPPGGFNQGPPNRGGFVPPPGGVPPPFGKAPPGTFPPGPFPPGPFPPGIPFNPNQPPPGSRPYNPQGGNR